MTGVLKSLKKCTTISFTKLWKNSSLKWTCNGVRCKHSWWRIQEGSWKKLKGGKTCLSAAMPVSSLVAPDFVSTQKWSYPSSIASIIVIGMTLIIAWLVKNSTLTLYKKRPTLFKTNIWTTCRYSIKVVVMLIKKLWRMIWWRGIRVESNTKSTKMTSHYRAGSSKLSKMVFKCGN